MKILQFLLPHIYSIEPTSAALIGSQIVGGLGGLFGGGGDSTANDPNFFAIAAAQALQQDTNLHQSNLQAGASQNRGVLRAAQMAQNNEFRVDDENQSKTSVPAIAPIPQVGPGSTVKTMAQKNQELSDRIKNQQLRAQLKQIQPKPWYSGIMDTGKDILKSSASALASSGINYGLNKLTQPKNQQLGNFPRTVMQAKMSGEAQRQYMNTAYPGTNPWEQLGGATGQSQGGAHAAQIGAQAGIERAQIGAHAGIAGAHISAAPHIKRIDYLTPSEIQKNVGQAHLSESQAHFTGGAQTRLTDVKAHGQSIANDWLPRLNKANEQLTISKDRTENYQGSKTMQQFFTEIQKTGIAQHDKEIKRITALWMHAINASKGIVAAGVAATIAGKAIRWLGTLKNPTKAAGSFSGQSSKLWKKYKKANPWTP